MYSSTRSHCAKHEIKLRTVHAGAARYRRLDSLSSESKWAKFSSANLAERGDEMWVRRRPTFSGKQNWKRTRRLSGPNGSARAEWNAPETADCVCTRTILETRGVSRRMNPQLNTLLGNLNNKKGMSPGRRAREAHRRVTRTREGLVTSCSINLISQVL